MITQIQTFNTLQLSIIIPIIQIKDTDGCDYLAIVIPVAQIYRLNRLQLHVPDYCHRDNTKLYRYKDRTGCNYLAIVIHKFKFT